MTFDFSMFLSFIHQTHLPPTSLLFIYNTKSMQRLRTCVYSIPAGYGSPVDALTLSCLTQVSDRHGRNLCQPGSNKCSTIYEKIRCSRRSRLFRGSPVYRACSLHINMPLKLSLCLIVWIYHHEIGMTAYSSIKS